jgi:mRNA interferase MazF
MEGFVKGDIVVLPFPFSDLSSSKKRPAYVAAAPGGDDLILCQITSQPKEDSVEISGSELSQGKLNLMSYVRITKIFTADKSIIAYRLGSIKKEKIETIQERIAGLFS